MKPTEVKGALSAVAIAIAAVGAIAASTNAAADVALLPFYAGVAQMKPEGKLGQILKKEEIDTSITGARAWRIAYVSSDVADRKTISTGLVVAPTGTAPKEGRPVV